MAMAKKKNNSFTKETTHIIDHDGGEILRSEIITRKRVTADKFVQLYLDDFGALMGIEGEGEYRLILWCAKNMNYDTNEVIIVNALKKRIAAECDLSPYTINNAVSALVTKNLLLRKDTSIYMLNPNYFFKGKIDDRAALIRTVEYYIQEAGADDVAVVDE
jgi:hypothetical protein